MKSVRLKLARGTVDVLILIERLQVTNEYGTEKTSSLGRRVLEELYKASRAPARLYEFIRRGDHVSALPICEPKRPVTPKPAKKGSPGIGFEDAILELMGTGDEPEEGILGPLLCLARAGIKTFNSCQGHAGREGHTEPVIWFHGDENEGRRAYKIAQEAGWLVDRVSRVYYSRQGEGVEYWEIVFRRGAGFVSMPDCVRIEDAFARPRT